MIITSILFPILLLIGYATSTLNAAEEMYDDKITPNLPIDSREVFQ